RAAQLASLAITLKAREFQRRFFRKSDIPAPQITCFEDLSLSEEENKQTFKELGGNLSEDLLRDLVHMQQASQFGSLIIPLSKESELSDLMVQCEHSIRNSGLFQREKLEQIKIALSQLKRLNLKFATTVTNPPYMGSGKMNHDLSKWLQMNYPLGKYDLFSCFIERSFTLISLSGFTGLVTMESWMFLSSFEKFRKFI